MRTFGENLFSSSEVGSIASLVTTTIIHHHHHRSAGMMNIP
jgi:hypothetical protein